MIVVGLRYLYEMFYPGKFYVKVDSKGSGGSMEF